MSNQFWLARAQLARVAPFFPASMGHATSMISASSPVSFTLSAMGRRWRDATAAYGSHKTLYSRFVRRSRHGIFNRIFAGLVGQVGEPDQLMIDAAHLKAP
jgi:transposase